jgi:hypothetical protein
MRNLSLALFARTGALYLSSIAERSNGGTQRKSVDYCSYAAAWEPRGFANLVARQQVPFLHALALMTDETASIVENGRRRVMSLLRPQRSARARGGQRHVRLGAWRLLAGRGGAHGWLESHPNGATATPLCSATRCPVCRPLLPMAFEGSTSPLGRQRTPNPKPRGCRRMPARHHQSPSRATSCQLSTP